MTDPCPGRPAGAGPSPAAGGYLEGGGVTRHPGFTDSLEERVAHKVAHAAVLPGEGHGGVPCRLLPGYGRIRFRSRWLCAPRAVWEAARGPLPAGMAVAPVCGTRSCGELAHLAAVRLEERLGTPGPSPEAKALVDAAIAAGDTVDEIAAATGVAYSTVRWRKARHPDPGRPARGAHPRKLARLRELLEGTGIDEWPVKAAAAEAGVSLPTAWKYAVKWGLRAERLEDTLPPPGSAFRDDRQAS